MGDQRHLPELAALQERLEQELAKPTDKELARTP